MEERDLRTHTFLKLAAGVMLTLSLAACSSDDDAEPSVQDAPAPSTAAATTIAAAATTPSAPRAITVRSGEGEAGYFFEPKDLSLSIGTVNVTLENGGPERPHTWAVKNKNGEGDLAKIERTAVGSTGTVEFNVTEAGTYEIYCTLPGHADRGQRGTLNVTGT
jgi:uncharacterized cupredoxin-like copper-binding protein